eukprot:scaffold83230_cov62-Phaeocystis_antarctica.AAC.6
MQKPKLETRGAELPRHTSPSLAPSEETAAPLLLIPRRPNSLTCSLGTDPACRPPSAKAMKACAALMP